MKKNNSGRALNNTMRLVGIWLLLLACGVAQAGSWKSLADYQGLPPSDDEKLCAGLLKHLNTVRSDRCYMDGIETYPEFSEPPWENLDPKKHIDLIAKLERYWQIGGQFYFSAPTDIPGDRYYNRAKLFIDEGGELKVWRTRLLSFYDGEHTRKVPNDAEQTIVELVAKIPPAIPSKECHGTTSNGWVRAPFSVLPDLSGPDPQIEAGLASILLITQPVLYRGQPRLINSENVWRDFNLTGLRGICDFQFIPSKPRSNQSAKPTEK
jgi:hypothetical protein